MSLPIIKLVNEIKAIHKKIKDAHSYDKLNEWDETIGKSISYLTTNKNLPEPILIESLTGLLRKAKGILEKVHAPLNMNPSILI